MGSSFAFFFNKQFSEVPFEVRTKARSPTTVFQNPELKLLTPGNIGNHLIIKKYCKASDRLLECEECEKRFHASMLKP